MLAWHTDHHCGRTTRFIAVERTSRPFCLLYRACWLPHASALVSHRIVWAISTKAKTIERRCTWHCQWIWLGWNIPSSFSFSFSLSLFLSIPLYLPSARMQLACNFEAIQNDCRGNFASMHLFNGINWLHVFITAFCIFTQSSIQCRLLNGFNAIYLKCFRFEMITQAKENLAVVVVCKDEEGCWMHTFALFIDSEVLK